MVVTKMVIFLVLFFLQSNTLLAQPEIEITKIDICFGDKDLTPRYDPKNDKFNDEILKDVLTKKAKQKVTRGRNIEDSVGDKTPALGSNETVTNPAHDAGLLSTIVEAYDRHFNLRTSPDDWWYHIIQTVAMDIDNLSKHEDERIKNITRNFFVQHEGKKELTVVTGPSIYGTDYAWFFDQMAKEIKANINKPRFVDAMASPNFSTTTPIHRLVANVVLMKSLEEFFSYVQYTFCGIPQIEMKGKLQDWELLPKKIEDLRNLIRPLERLGKLGERDGRQSWWDRVITVANKLVDTFNDKPDSEWWSKIISRKSYGSGAPEFNGWFMTDVLNVPDANTIADAPSGLVSVPMKITDGKTSENATVLAGLSGYKFLTDNGNYVVEPAHGWALLLPPDSSFRKELKNWEDELNGV